ncbi:hypothetical protein [Lacinutrix sp. Bg11-31]|uniref:hypothetical protein n=1 Tax=Lacinutrix sp. Bg11-31 TaxID=2057808 RepID=UPI000C304CB5|nr:hypothetical protein [Lacinutrix sp. Bg11-31]AUC81595.1 hypothetical protein CW733_05390 [Lacinutrix sp. Bg11-31]
MGCNSGERMYYSENGEIIRKTKFDDFGNVLEDIEFDKKGRITKEIKAIKINFKPELDEASKLNFEFETTLHSEKQYKYSRKLKQMYVSEEGLLLDDERNGKWLFYKSNDELKKEKIYK